MLLQLKSSEKKLVFLKKTNKQIKNVLIQALTSNKSRVLTFIF